MELLWFGSGLFLGLASVLVSVVVVGSLRASGGSGITLRSSSAMAPALPFVIKDDARELVLENEALGYRPVEKFDNVEGLGR